MAAVLAAPHRLAAAALLFAAVGLLSLPAARAVNVQYCQRGADYPVKVNGVEFIPDPIQRGSPVTFKISATTADVISNGKLVIDVDYFFFRVHEEVIDLCNETACPATGDFIMAHEQILPGLTPPGSYTLTMKLLGEDGHQLTCVTFGFSIGMTSPAVDI